MADILVGIPKHTPSSHVLLGIENNEDAAVLSIPQDMAIVQTVDFFTPIVNDPYFFGRIAAANALSDVYVMGGTPWCAMNLVMFPTDEKPLEILEEILRGGSDALHEAGAPLVGGHSITDDSIKYGLCVTGVIDPNHIASNSGLAVGDILILTKPLGTGILVSAIKNEVDNSQKYEDSLIHWASKLNKGVAQAIRSCGIKACTDITGFGLGGHALEMAKASHKSVIIEGNMIPAIEGVYNLLQEGFCTGGGKRNRDYAQSDCYISHEIDPLYITLAFDPQTSGGVLIAVNEKNVKKVLNVLAENNEMGYIVGYVEDKSDEKAFLSIK